MKKLLFVLLLLPAAVSATPALPADTVLLRQFLEAVADNHIPDSVLVARFMCPNYLFRPNEPRIDTIAALLRSSLFMLRVSLQRHLESLRRSKFIPFSELTCKPFVLVDGEEGVYAAVDGLQPRMYLLIRDKRVVAFEVTGSQGKAHFHDYCR